MDEVMQEVMYGITYTKPQVVLLQDTGIGVAETAARTCYDSFSNSENSVIQNLEKICRHRICVHF